jgi:C4-dicarboxylate transporter, DctM subunit
VSWLQTVNDRFESARSQGRANGEGPQTTLLSRAYLRGPIVVSGWIAGLAGDDPYKIMFALVALFTIKIGGINPVHMGVVLIVTLAFGLITPPYGLALLMASKFVGVRFSQALRALLSIYLVFFATIAAAIFLPDVVLWLPKHLFPESVGCFKNPSGAGCIYL